MRGAQRANLQLEQQTELPNFEHCKEQLIKIASFYSITSKAHDREWDEVEKQNQWEDSVRKATTVGEITPLIIKLNEGMSLPTSLIKREDRI